MEKYLHPLCTMRGVEHPVIGIDFDGTIATQIPYAGPGIFGKPIAGAAAAMVYFKSLGYMIAVFTSRGPESYPAIREYCFNNKINIDYVNENPNHAHFIEYSINKPAFDLYIDDKGCRFNGSWKEVIANIKGLRFPYWMKGRKQ